MASDGVERILVTGASGYVATHVVQQLQQAGYKVRGTVRSLTNEKKVAPLKALCPEAKHELELVEADLTKDDCWTDAVRGCSHVIHTASPFPVASPKNEDELIKPAVEGTTKVLQACVDVGGVKRVVLTSSCAAIADFRSTNTVPLTEDSWRDLNTDDYYSKSKTMAEKAAWNFVEKLPAESKFELAVINPSLVLGPVLCGSPGTSIEIIRRVMERDPFLVPRLNVACCDVRDVGKAHVVAMTLPEAVGHRHILAPHNPWFMDIANILAEEFKDKGYRPPSKHAPNFMIKFMGLFDSAARTMSHHLGCKTVLSNKRMEEVLGIKPYDIKDTLIDMAYSCIDRGFIKKTPNYFNPRAASNRPDTGTAAS